MHQCCVLLTSKYEVEMLDMRRLLCSGARRQMDPTISACRRLQLRVDLSLDMILSPRDGLPAVGGLDALQEGSEASSSVAGTSSSAAGPSGEFTFSMTTQLQIPHRVDAHPKRLLSLNVTKGPLDA